MKELFKQAIVIFAAGFIMIAGIRIAEHVFPRPENRLIICITDGEGELVGECKPFSDYLEEQREPEE